MISDGEGASLASPLPGSEQEFFHLTELAIMSDTLPSRAFVQKLTALHNLSENVHFRASQAGMPMDRVATRARLSEDVVEAICRGHQTHVTLDNLAALAFALDCSVIDLLSEPEYV